MPMFVTVPNQLLGKFPPTLGSYDSFAVTPADGADLPLNDQGKNVNRIKVATGGDVVATLASGGDVTITLTDGESTLVDIVRIKSTGTTAVGITGMYE